MEGGYEVEETDIDVLICGAGPAGLVVALELARRGVRHILIDKADGPFSGSRGKGIQPRTLEIFDDIEVLDRIMATGGPYPLLRNYRPDLSFEDSAMMESREPTLAEPYPMPLMIPQFLTEGILRDRLREFCSRPRFANALTSFEQDAGGVRAMVTTAAGEKAILARYLVGTDGGRSTVRGALGIDFPGRSLETRAIVADLVVSGLDRDVWHRFRSTAEDCATLLCPLAGTSLFQLQAPVPLEGDVDLSSDGLAAFIRERTGRSDITVHSVEWASLYTMSARLAERYRIDRVFVAGDAAHIHPPTGAQGLNTSVQDAYNLGWKLAAVISGAPETLLDSYEAERRPIAEAMLNLSKRLLGEAKGATMRRGSDTRQLDLGYPNSSVAMAGSRANDILAAGDRAPDAPLTTASGQSLRMFDLLRGPHWTLIGVEIDRSALAPRPGLRIHVIGSDIVDDHGQFCAAYGLATGEWVLVRPDGYIAAIGAGDALPSLDAFLTSFAVSA